MRRACRRGARWSTPAAPAATCGNLQHLHRRGLHRRRRRVVVAKHGNRAMSGSVGGRRRARGARRAHRSGARAGRRVPRRGGHGLSLTPRLFHPANAPRSPPARRELRRAHGLQSARTADQPGRRESATARCFAPEWVEPLAHALARLGSRRALVVHATTDSTSSLSPGPVWVAELQDGAVHTIASIPTASACGAASPPT
jgi:anthranilate phosphoribosyltransferase